VQEEAPAPRRQPQQQLPIAPEQQQAVVAEAAVAAPEVREPAPQPVRAERPAPVAAAPVAAPAPVANGRALPKVQPFELPLDELAQIAQNSGLQWVNSDAERIAQARAAIAAEPKPVHVPRERPPVVVLDEGPLVLVETRRDLGSMSLPFEQQQQQQHPL
jgi:ribonuclease E